jgi:hypothetical protein
MDKAEYINMKLAGQGYSPSGVSVSNNGTVRVDWPAGTSDATQAAGNTYAAALDSSPAAIAAYATSQSRAAAKAALSSGEGSVVLRAALRILYGALVETRARANQISPGLPALSTPTFAQFLAAVSSQVDGE